MNQVQIPKVSVLLPAYNAEKYIGAAIGSILDQTFKDFELIIVDDCSTDKTPGVIQSYSERDGRIVVVRNPQNLGISGTRNKLLSLAKGKYVVWQDADDISLKKRIEKQFQFMESNPEVGLCGGYLEFFKGERTLSIRKYEADDSSLREKIFRYSPVAQPAAIIRRSLVDVDFLFDTTLTQAEDLDFFLRLGRVSRFANLQEVVIRYRMSASSITVRRLKENIQQTLLVRERAARSYGYRMTPVDKVFRLLTRMFQFMPPMISYYVFNFVRNS